MSTFLRALQRVSWAVCACLVSSAASAQALEVIDLKYRSAQEVIPVLQPLLEPGAALSGQDYKLFVRTSAANLSQLRAALAQIDREPRQLLVSVRQSTYQEIERERVAGSGTVRAGDAEIAVNERPRAGSGVTVRATDTARRREGSGIASVQVIEGNSALIATGTSVPLVTTLAVGAGRRPWAAATTSHREFSSGFVVTPRVNGERVILDIAQRNERISGADIETQRLTTQVSGRLGEWIALGGISESSSSTRSGALNRQYATHGNERSIWVKVETATSH